jgi:hypothetical protein
MKLLVKLIDSYTNIKIWNVTEATCVVQEFKNGDKSKKATAKIKYYNDRPYITCKGHRYYLEEFEEVEI